MKKIKIGFHAKTQRNAKKQFQVKRQNFEIIAQIKVLFFTPHKGFQLFSFRFSSRLCVFA
ncbi:MAG: hypothetical protein C0615_09995 [Desulfuromonas sp.]|nr:MAG: hypothetical protein C0615_09995 [Desulfuromonas sp.]